MLNEYNFERLKANVIHYKHNITLKLHIWFNIIHLYISRMPYFSFKVTSEQSTSSSSIEMQRGQSMKTIVTSLRSRKDFASKNSGATILKSSSGIKNAANILSKSNDEYLLMPECNEKVEKQELIIHLSEEVSVEYILADNHEDFSANLKEINFYGSSDYPPKNNKWKKIGKIRPENDLNYHLADMDEGYSSDKNMIRYLRVTMTGKEGNQLYCTLTHLQVFGKSMHLSLKESFKDVNKNSTHHNETRVNHTSSDVVHSALYDTFKFIPYDYDYFSSHHAEWQQYPLQQF